MKKVISIMVSLALFMSLSACGKKEIQDVENSTSSSTKAIETTKEVTESTTKEVVEMKVQCNSVTAENKLLTKCAATYANGTNFVPEIEWTAVDGATCYAIYMIDGSANNWLHMMALTTDTKITEGQSIDGQYIGPYPPSGNHEYTFYVFALSEKPSSLPGNFNSTNGSLDTIKSGLGTILDECQTSVFYANGDNNK